MGERSIGTRTYHSLSPERRRRGSRLRPIDYESGVHPSRRHEHRVEFGHIGARAGAALRVDPLGTLELRQIHQGSRQEECVAVRYP